MWQPTAHAPSRSSASASAATRSGSGRVVVPRALPRQPRDARTTRSTRSPSRRCARRSTTAARDRGRRRRLPRRLAPRRRASRPASSASCRRSRELLEHCSDDDLARCSRTRPAPAGRSAARSTSSRRSSTRSTATRGSASASTPATGGSPASTSTDPDALDAALGGARRADRARPAARLHVNDAAAPLGSNRDRHANARAGGSATASATFLAHPAFQGLPAMMETAGPGRDLRPDAAERRRSCATCTPAAAEARRAGAQPALGATSVDCAKTRKLGRSSGSS